MSVCQFLTLLLGLAWGFAMKTGPARNLPSLTGLGSRVGGGNIDTIVSDSKFATCMIASESEAKPAWNYSVYLGCGV